MRIHARPEKITTVAKRSGNSPKLLPFYNKRIGAIGEVLRGSGLVGNRTSGTTENQHEGNQNQEAEPKDKSFSRYTRWGFDAEIEQDDKQCSEIIAELVYFYWKDINALTEKTKIEAKLLEIEAALPVLFQELNLDASFSLSSDFDFADNFYGEIIWKGTECAGNIQLTNVVETFNHRVKKGDTLSELELKYGVDRAELIKLNPQILKRGNFQINIGENLRIPFKPGALPTRFSGNDAKSGQTLQLRSPEGRFLPLHREDFFGSEKLIVDAEPILTKISGSRFITNPIQDQEAQFRPGDVVEKNERHLAQIMAEDTNVTYDWLTNKLNENIISDSDITEILRTLEKVYRANPLEFADIVIKLKGEGELEILFDQIDYIHLSNHHDIILKLSFFMSTKKLFEDINSMTNLSLLGIIKNSYPGAKAYISDENPLEKIKANWQEKTINNAKAYRNLKLYEIQYYLNNMDYERVSSILNETVWTLDNFFEILFSEGSPDSEIIDNLSSPASTLFEDWDIGQDKDLPWHLKKIFKNWDAKQKVELTPNIDLTLEGIKIELRGQQDPKAVTSPPPQPDNKPGTHQTVKDIIGNVRSGQGALSKPKSLSDVVTASADEFFLFFQELGALSKKYPILLTMFNDIVENKDYSNLLSSSVQFDLKNRFAGDIFSKNTLDNVDWLELVYIWFYELGPKAMQGTVKEKVKENDRVMERFKNPITFGSDAKTTKELIKLKGTQKAIQVAHYLANSNNIPLDDKNNGALKGHQLQDGGSASFLIHYDVPAFKNALRINNIPFNFLGSFTITCNRIGDELHFRAYNEMGLASALRFRAAKEPGGERGSILENRLRSSEGPQVGGTLALQWEWTEKIKGPSEDLKQNELDRIEILAPGEKMPFIIKPN